ncbi:MAG TPA: nucleotidyltransferase family protein [Solirubrobacteraceae bacterium]|nr:nucleotidyltransferase family protein [Solirubrobacteraceae bacterium]
MTSPDPHAAAILSRVEEIVEPVENLTALRQHRLELVAARVWREQGRCVPHELRVAERRSAIVALTAPEVLRRVRAAYDGSLVLMKGPEVAACYPHPSDRAFCDLDFLAGDPVEAYRALVAAGFVEVGDPALYEDVHHLRPLVWPDLPLFIELHKEVNLPDWLAPPPTPELLELTRPSATGVDGLRAPVPAAHAVLLAAHGWAHEPLRRLMDVIDVAVVLDDEERDLAAELARRWNLERLWRITVAAADALLRGSRSGLALRTWARHLPTVRERTVLETHLTRWAGPVCGLPNTRLRALGDGTVIFTGAARPRNGEGWVDAIRRTRLAMLDAFHPQSQHDLIKESRSGR